MLTNENLMALDVDITTAEDAIQLGGALLNAEGRVKDTYGDAVAKRELVFPTGLALSTMNIAIPHTDPEHVNENAVCLVRPKTPIPFGAMGGDGKEKLDCSLIFLLAMNGAEDQLTLLRKLMLFFQDENMLASVLNSSDKKEIAELLKDLGK